MIAIEGPSLERPRPAQLRAVEHELRTPLALLKGYLDMARNGDIPWATALDRCWFVTLDMEAVLERLLDPEQPWPEHPVP